MYCSVILLESFESSPSPEEKPALYELEASKANYYLEEVREVVHLSGEVDEGLKCSTSAKVFYLFFKKEVLHGESLWFAMGSSAELGSS